jgi:hypothetical protein
MAEEAKFTLFTFLVGMGLILIRVIYDQWKK